MSIPRGWAGTGKVHASYPQKLYSERAGVLPVLHPSSVWNPEALDPHPTSVMNRALSRLICHGGLGQAREPLAVWEGGKQPSALSSTSVVRSHDKQCSLVSQARGRSWPTCCITLDHLLNGDNDSTIRTV